MHKIFHEVDLDSSLYTIKTYNKDDVVFFDGDECFYIGFVCSGNISIYTQTLLEYDYEINNISENGMFGAFILFSSNNTYLGTGVATKKTKVVVMSKLQLLKAFNNQKFLLNYLELTSSISIDNISKIKILSQKTIKDKILFLLSEHYKRTNRVEFYFKSKQMLANYLNIPRPSLSRELINLKKEGYLDYDLKCIKINSSFKNTLKAHINT